MSNPTEHIAGKMFIGGLSLNTTAKSLREYFEKKYGVVSDCVLMVDKVTGRSRGFGFVTMQDYAVLAKVMAERPHNLDGKEIDCKEAVPKESPSPVEVKKDFKTKKIFVGGLPHDLNEDEFKEYFNKFGKVTDCVIMKDKDTQKPRGFGFVTFETEDDVEEVLMHYKTHQMKGKWIDCKKATPKASSPTQFQKSYHEPSNMEPYESELFSKIKMSPRMMAPEMYPSYPGFMNPQNDFVPMMVPNGFPRMQQMGGPLFNPMGPMSGMSIPMPLSAPIGFMAPPLRYRGFTPTPYGMDYKMQLHNSPPPSYEPNFELDKNSYFEVNRDSKWK